MLARITVFLLFLITHSAFAQSASASDQLSSLLQNLQTFQADFSQTIQDKTGKTLSESSGTMALQRPGHFRWETIKPNQQLIIADGKSLWIYDKDLAQVTQQKQNASTNAPGLLLSDSVSHIINRFLITAKAENSFKLIPKGKKDLFQSVELNFGADNTLKQMILHDNLGQITQISFTQAKTNLSLPSRLFHFRAPPDIEITQQ